MVETTEYLGMLRRMIRAAGRRVGENDEIELAELINLHHDLDQAIAAAIRVQREQYGKSWQSIAAATGTTRQSAFERWHNKAS